MALYLLVPIGALVAAFVFVVVRARQPADTSPPAAAREPIASDLEAEVRRLLAGGQKVEAIKLLRERTGAGLAEAKTAVESLEAGGPAALAARPAVRAELEAELRAFLPDRKIEAIKLYRERTGAGLKEAKEAVEALER